MLASFPVHAQTRWAELQSTFRLTPKGRPPWRLLLRFDARTRSRFPADFEGGRLVLEGLDVRWISPQYWPSTPEAPPAASGWALQDPQGRTLRHGTTMPSGSDLEEALRGALGALPWDALEKALKAEPLHGEARIARASWALAMSGPATRFAVLEQNAAWGVPGLALPDISAKELERFLEVPEWPSQIELGSADPDWRFGPLIRAGAPPAYRQRMTDAVFASLRDDTANPRLQRNLAFLLPLLEPEDAYLRIERLENLTPLPGQAWPPLPLIHAAMGVWRKQAKWLVIRETARQWSSPTDRLFLDGPAWRTRLEREAALRTYLRMADSWLDGWNVLPEALDDLRKHTGSRYQDCARALIAGAYLPGDPAFLQLLNRLAGRPAFADPPMPEALPPFLLQVSDGGQVPVLRQAFDSPELVFWLPSECRIHAQPGLPGQFSLDLGAERLALLPRLPGPAWLSDTLGAARLGRLWKAHERVGADPQAPGPRRLRASLLRARMPLPDPESLLMEDLRRLGEGTDLEDWAINETLWFTESTAALQVVEDRLRHWPQDADRWAALAFWTTFRPAHPGPILLADDLPSWKQGLTLPLCLPAKAHLEIAKALEGRKAWRRMRAWFDPAWAALLDLPLEHPDRRRLVRETGPAVSAALDRCLGMLDLAAERRSVQASWKQLLESVATPESRKERGH